MLAESSKTICSIYIKLVKIKKKKNVQIKTKKQIDASINAIELTSELVGALKMTDMKLQDMKLTDRVAGHEIAGHENGGPNSRT